jgi:hypothetical protein
MHILILKVSGRKAKVYLVYEDGRRVLIDTIVLGVVSMADAKLMLENKYNMSVSTAAYLSPANRRYATAESKPYSFDR